MRSLGWTLIRHDWCLHKRSSGHGHVEGRPCENTGRRGRPHAQEKGLRGSHLLLGKPPVCGALLRWPSKQIQSSLPAPSPQMTADLLCVTDFSPSASLYCISSFPFLAKCWYSDLYAMVLKFVTAKTWEKSRCPLIDERIFPRDSSLSPSWTPQESRDLVHGYVHGIQEPRPGAW